jgi:hypothetical protein
MRNRELCMQKRLCKKLCFVPESPVKMIPRIQNFSSLLVGIGADVLHIHGNKPGHRRREVVYENL